MPDASHSTAAPEEEQEPLLQLGPEFADSVNYRIRMAQILAYRAFEKRLPGYGGAARYLGLLSIIRSNPGQPQTRLADAVGLQRSSVVPILDKMEANGIVERRDIAGDRRSKAVYLTAEGEKVVAELTAPALEMERKTVAGLSPDAVKDLLKGLDHIIQNLRKE